jgi:hypothetical protein
MSWRNCASAERACRTAPWLQAALKDRACELLGEHEIDLSIGIGLNVIHRKVSLGTQSENGELFTRTPLSAAATCRLQRRSLFIYFSDLITAHTRGDPCPALA